MLVQDTIALAGFSVAQQTFGASAQSLYPSLKFTRAQLPSMRLRVDCSLRQSAD